MKKKTIFLTVLFAVALVLLIIYFAKKQKRQNVKEKTKSEIIKKVKENKKIVLQDTIIAKDTTEKQEKIKKQKEDKSIIGNEKKFSWKELNIEPLNTPEGDYYTITAFEVYNGNLVTTGNYNNRNVLKFYKNGILNEIELKDIPLDMLYEKGKLYVLCLSHLYVFKNEEIISKVAFDIPRITLYDKLLDFDGVFNILMSDGSAYQLIDNKFVRTKHLMTKNNTEMWIKKTSPKSFEIRTSPNDTKMNKKKTYQNEIGSITFIGNSSENYYCIIDIIEKTKPLTVERAIFSSKDNFNKQEKTFSNKNWTYIKNDIKLHGDTLFYIFANKSELTLNSTIL